MKHFKIIILSIALASCSSLKNEDAFNQHLANKECEQALIENQPSSSMEILSTTAQGTGTAASYLLTGLGYTTDIIVQFGGGIAVGVIVCSPIIVLETSGVGSEGRASAQCLAEVGGTIVEGADFMKLGKTSHKKTKKWRCPNYDKLSEGFRKVARCYYDKGEINKSRLQLQQVRNDREFYQCLSSDEQGLLDKELNFYSR